MSYTGYVSATIRGDSCQPWKLYTFTDADFPDGSVEAAFNFCRNPRNVSVGPWCFDVENELRHCDVLLCSSAGWYLMLISVIVANPWIPKSVTFVWWWLNNFVKIVRHRRNNLNTLWRFRHHLELFSCSQALNITRKRWDHIYDMWKYFKYFSQPKGYKRAENKTNWNSPVAIYIIPINIFTLYTQ